MMKKSSTNQVRPIPKRNNETRRDGKTEDRNNLPLGQAALIIQEDPIHNAEEGRVSPSQKQNGEESSSHSKKKKTDSSCFDPSQPIHPRCNYISYGCLTMAFLLFVYLLLQMVKKWSSWTTKIELAGSVFCLSVRCTRYLPENTDVVGVKNSNNKTFFFLIFFKFFSILFDYVRKDDSVIHFKKSKIILPLFRVSGCLSGKKFVPERNPEQQKANSQHNNI